MGSAYFASAAKVIFVIQQVEQGQLVVAVVAVVVY